MNNKSKSIPTKEMKPGAKNIFRDDKVPHKTKNLRSAKAMDVAFRSLCLSGCIK